MKLVADKNGRICSAELFPPRTAFDASPQPDGSVRMVKLVETDVPLVKPILSSCPIKGASKKRGKRAFSTQITP
jgi:hypothetical protein